jgi:hypothetical protein
MNRIFHLKMFQVYLTLANDGSTGVGNLTDYTKIEGSNPATASS